MTEDQMVKEIPENSKVDLSSDDIIKFGEMNFMNGEMACLEFVLSLKRDQISFQTRKMLESRYKGMKSIATKMQHEVMSKAMPEMFKDEKP